MCDNSCCCCLFIVMIIVVLSCADNAGSDQLLDLLAHHSVLHVRGGGGRIARHVLQHFAHHRIGENRLDFRIRACACLCFL
jgi:hypothetical protein